MKKFILSVGVMFLTLSMTSTTTAFGARRILKKVVNDGQARCHVYIEAQKHKYLNAHNRRKYTLIYYLFVRKFGTQKFKAVMRSIHLSEVAKAYHRKNNCRYNRTSTPFSTDSIDLDSLEDE